MNPLDFELLSSAREDKFSDIIYAPGTFYHDDWLLLPGGINPTCPAGEHGKYWGVPWKVSVLEDNGQRVTVRMWMTDHIDWPGRPWKLDNGLTGLTADRVRITGA